MNQSFCPNTSTENYPKSTSTMNFETIKSIFTPAMVRHTCSRFICFRKCNALAHIVMIHAKQLPIHSYTHTFDFALYAQRKHTPVHLYTQLHYTRQRARLLIALLNPHVSVRPRWAAVFHHTNHEQGRRPFQTSRRTVTSNLTPFYLTTFASFQPGFTQGLGMAKSYKCLVFVFLNTLTKRKNILLRIQASSSSAHSAQNDLNAPRKWVK